MSAPPGGHDDAQALRAVTSALRLVSVTFPHLAGLAHLVRTAVDRRVSTVGIFPSGRMLVNPAFVVPLALHDLAFVMAHELLHLALQTSARTNPAERFLYNVAHDYIINDILSHELGRPVPAGGLALAGARHLGLEVLVGMLKKQKDRPRRCWHGKPPAPGILGRALRDAGLVPDHAAAGAEPGDLLTDEMERQWFPESGPAEADRQREAVRRTAARANSLRALGELLERARDKTVGTEAGDESAMVRVLRDTYRPPWELALQRWLDFVAPGERTFARPSRRGGDRTDLVLPGRRREGWTLHAVLDTSGSMADALPRILGHLASFCEGAGVAEVHLLQCDVEVTVDEYVRPEDLEEYEVRGLGGSNLSAAMFRLADDPEVQAAVVLTDGYIDYPASPAPYHVLWVLSGEDADAMFQPGYGTVLQIDAG
jgi:predicted metal-dependent peptidase